MLPQGCRQATVEENQSGSTVMNHWVALCLLFDVTYRSWTEWIMKTIQIQLQYQVLNFMKLLTLF